MKYTAVIFESDRYSGVPLITIASYEALNDRMAKLIAWKQTYKEDDEVDLDVTEEELDEWLEEQDMSDTAIVAIRREDGKRLFLSAEIYFETWKVTP